MERNTITGRGLLLPGTSQVWERTACPGSALGVLQIKSSSCANTLSFEAIASRGVWICVMSSIKLHHRPSHSVSIRERGERIRESFSP
jgi:hypothetical protein